MLLIDGVIVTKIYDFIILPIIHITLLLRSNKLWKRKNQIYVTTLYLMNFLYNQKLVRNWYLNNSKIILEVKDLGQLWRIFKHLACYYISTQFGVSMPTGHHIEECSCFNADGSRTLKREIWNLVFQCLRVMGFECLFLKAQRPPSQNLWNEKMEKLLIICK